MASSCLLLDEAKRFTHGKPMGRTRSQDKPEPLYPPDARTELWHTEVDKEGYTVKTYRVYKNNDVDEYKVRSKGSANKPEKHIYPIDANRRIISRTIDHEGFTVTVYCLTAPNGDETDMVVRAKQN